MREPRDFNDLPPVIEEQGPWNEDAPVTEGGGEPISGIIYPEFPARLEAMIGLRAVPIDLAWRIEFAYDEMETAPIVQSEPLWTAAWRQADGKYYRVDFTQVTAGVIDEVNAVSAAYINSLFSIQAANLAVWQTGLYNDFAAYQLAVNSSLAAYQVTINGEIADFETRLIAAESDIAAAVATVVNKLDDAPADGATYGRQNNTWVNIAGGISVSWASVTGKPDVLIDDVDVLSNPALFRLKQVAATNGRMQVMAPLGNSATFEAGVGTVAYWVVGRAATTSHWEWNAYDIGGYLGTPLRIRYNDGIVDFEQRPVFNSATPWDSLNFDPTLKANLNSPAFTGLPTAPTKAIGDNGVGIATTAFVKSQGYATLLDPIFTGNPQAPTPVTADADTSIETTAFVKNQSYAPLTSPVFAGTPTAPTGAQGVTVAAQLATKGFVDGFGRGSGGARLEYISSTQVTVRVAGGGNIFINGQNWQVTAVTLNASAGTLSAINYVYAYIVAGAVAYEVSTTAPVVDTTYGYMRKGADATRHLIGCFYRWADGFVYDADNLRTVASWYHRRRVIAAVSSSGSSSSGTQVAYGPAGYILQWPDTSFTLKNHVYFTNTVNAIVLPSIILDGVPGTEVGANVLAGQYASGTSFITSALAGATAVRGYQAASRTTAGTATYFGYIVGDVWL